MRTVIRLLLLMATCVSVEFALQPDAEAASCGVGACSITPTCSEAGHVVESAPFYGDLTCHGVHLCCKTGTTYMSWDCTENQDGSFSVSNVLCNPVFCQGAYGFTCCGVSSCI